MDVALYFPWLKERGGAEKVILKYAQESQHNVTIITGYYDPEKTFEGFLEVEVQSLSDREPEGFVDRLIRFELFNAVRKLDLEDYDAFIISTSGVGTSISLRNSDLPLYTYTHTPLRTALPEFKDSYLEDINPFFRPVYGLAIKFFAWLENLSYNRIDKSIANSETTKERMIDRNLMHREDIEVVNPGVDLDDEGKEYENYFLYPSRFRRYKRQHLAIEAFEEADLEDFKLVLAGSEQEEEYVEELRRKATEMDEVEIKTDVPGEEWKELYRNCYTVLFLAENEDWGIVPLEAGSYSKPVIAVNEAGPTESVIHGQTGFLSNPQPREIAEYMEELAEDREKAEEMGERGREEAEKYSWKGFAEKVNEVIG
jgi:alpha-1,3/alpha-1,6-mannosyltransferase